jgi:hypothetical protein
MKPAFLVLPLAMALCACAQTVMIADACKPAATASFGGSAALLGSGTSPALQSLARDDYSASRLTPAAVTTDCTRKNQAPRTYDLRRLGDGPAPPAILVGSNDERPTCPKARRA